MKLTKTTRVLITGAGGMLGTTLLRAIKSQVTTIPTSLHPEDHMLALDIRNQKDVKKMISTTKPDLIIHLAAITSPEYCENNPNDAFAVNTIATQTLATQAAKKGIHFVFISSSGIFDGKKQQYTEKDIPNPITVYGKTKWAAEQLVTALPNTLIVRPAWVVGGGPKKDKKFVGMIIRQIQSNMNPMYVVEDKIGTISYAPHVVETLITLVTEGKTGPHHVANDGICSRYDIARELVAISKKAITIHPVTSDYFQHRLFVPRPTSEALASDIIPKLPSWKKVLRAYINEW